MVDGLLGSLYGPQQGRYTNICVVPPYWWLEKQQNNVVEITHGWASWIDALQWVSGVGVYLVFSAMRAEYIRNMEDWVWIIVSQVQNTFNFTRN